MKNEDEKTFSRVQRYDKNPSDCTGYFYWLMVRRSVKSILCVIRAGGLHGRSAAAEVASLRDAGVCEHVVAPQMSLRLYGVTEISPLRGEGVCEHVVAPQMSLRLYGVVSPRRGENYVTPHKRSMRVMRG